MKTGALGAAVLVLLFGVTAANATEKPTLEEFLKGGEKDFHAHCASCHGPEGHGDGPVAAYLVKKPADLTTLAARNNGEFPTDQVYWIIDGRGDVAAHGPRTMPVWGLQFGGPDATESMTRKRILALVGYLKTLQTGMPAKADPHE